jgi:V8-like Glu-specific endopeptidase
MKTNMNVLITKIIKSKKEIQSMLLFSAANFYLSNVHACFFGYEDEYEIEMSSHGSYSPLPTHSKASGEDEALKTCVQELKKSKNRTGSKSYPTINPDVYTDGSKTTKGYEAPSRRQMHVGAKMGTDDRIRVHNTEKTPWRVHGHMEMRFPNGEWYIGSGTMVNYKHVLTAGHCLYDHEAGGWATAIKFTAAQNGGYIPIKSASATHLLTVKGWKDGRDSRFDMGMLILDRDLGEETGWYGISTDTDKFLKSFKINVTGYPGDKDKGSGTQMWTMPRPGRIAEVYPEQFTYTLDTTPGQSGSGVYTQFSEPAGYYCVGIHTQGKSDCNTATRITKSKFDLLISWINGKKLKN